MATAREKDEARLREEGVKALGDLGRRDAIVLPPYEEGGCLDGTQTIPEIVALRRPREANHPER